jgi:hypothetical protein
MAERSDPMYNAESYKLARENLLYDTLNLAGLIGTLFPATVRPGSSIAQGSGSHWENDDIRTVSKMLEQVTYRFDQVQHTLGLWQHEARFGHGPAGSTNPPPDEEQTNGRDEETDPEGHQAADRPEEEGRDRPREATAPPPAGRDRPGTCPAGLIPAG